MQLKMLISINRLVHFFKSTIFIFSLKGKKRRLTIIECGCDINMMIDLAKVADLVSQCGQWLSDGDLEQVVGYLSRVEEKKGLWFLRKW